jgi:HAD superfamily hydrolase (TIGR01509 family)
VATALRPAVDVDSVIGRWRGAFDAAQHALQAGRHDLSPAELRERARLLAEERAETVRLLESYAHDRNARLPLVRLVAAPWEARRLLGIPSDAAACVFNLDGVLIGSAEIHADAWRETFDDFLSRHIVRSGREIPLFSRRADYPRYIHGRPRVEGIREFLASRGISLPEGSPDDPPTADTVHGLANHKRLALLRRLDERGITAFEGARLYLELAHDAGVRCAVVSASANTETILERAHLAELVDDRVDANTMAAERLARKPAADTLLAACRHLGTPPERAVVFETTPEGIDAGRAGGFELVVGVARADAAKALRAHGADLVVADLGDIIEPRLAA